VALEGVVGPCPYCQASLTAPPLIQSPEYAAYYYAHQQAMAESVYATPASTWAPEETVMAQVAPQWATEFPSNEAFVAPTPSPALATPSWDEMLGSPAPVDLTSFQAPAEQPLYKEAPSLSNGANRAKLQRPFWLKLGLGVGILGLAAGVYFTLRPKPQPVSTYQPPEHVPLTPAQAAEIAAELKQAAPATPSVPLVPSAPPTPVVAAEAVAPAVSPVVAPAPPAEIEVAPKALPSQPPVAKVIPEEAPPSKSTPPDPSNLASPELEEPSLLTEPRASLKAFLTAANWKERAKFTQHAQELQREMKEYYTDHADGPIKADSIDYLTSQPTPDGKSRFHLFQVECGEGYGFPVSVESMDGSFKVDWRSFVEFKDLQLPKYFEKYSSEPATFHAVLHRSHYFGSDVPDQDDKICFAVEPPVTGYANFVWVDKSSTDIINKLGERAEFGFISYPVISLRWVKEKNGAAYVKLFQIVADNWRTDATVPKAKLAP
jgi:hypothetical protein